MDWITWGLLTMKLNDFTAVAVLIKERDYLRSLVTKADFGHPIKVGNTDVRPDIAERIRPELKLIFKQQIAVVDEKLAALGVTTDQEAA
ncbi:hypothetical protein [Bradyrhizobium sp. SZCCHNR2026]|uniref:hypothetical protein n=1 Tax=Bradyrhizobium sp. SZCCHNR2026 TaxID=3057381 RepID=UPI00291653A3|nr:hypothetical protein [Bradyrhizobium sp. SZCCHNR2026]